MSPINVTTVVNQSTLTLSTSRKYVTPCVRYVNGVWAVLSRRLSNTMDARFCVEALKQEEIKISMDGRGRCMDNIFIERLWSSLKNEAVYRNELSDGFVAVRLIGDWLDFYNTQLQHTAPSFIIRWQDTAGGL